MKTLIFIGSSTIVDCIFKNKLGQPTNPTDIKLTIYLPDGTPVVFENEDFEHDTEDEGAGIYTLVYTTTVAGRHKWRWEGTGAIVAVDQGFFEVQPLPNAA